MFQSFWISGRNHVSRELWPPGPVRVTVHSCCLRQVRQRFLLPVLSPWTSEAKIQAQQKWKRALQFLEWNRSVVSGSLASPREVHQASRATARCTKTLAEFHSASGEPWECRHKTTGFRLASYAEIQYGSLIRYHSAVPSSRGRLQVGAEVVDRKGTSRGGPSSWLKLLTCCISGTKIVADKVLQAGSHGTHKAIRPHIATVCNNNTVATKYDQLWSFAFYSALISSAWYALILKVGISRSRISWCSWTF